MPIQSDFHMHSSYSGDCNTPMEEMIKASINKGLKSICFTEHNDFDFPNIPEENINENTFLLNVDSYLYELIQLREKYQNDIKVLFGIEIGLQDSCLRKNIILSKSYDFDFIIASSHLCMGLDPYYPSFFQGKQTSACYKTYFEEMLNNVKKYIGYDVYGHLDYIARYAPEGTDSSFSYFDYQDLIDEILNTIISNEKGIECNTSGLRKKLNATNPSKDILKRYKELGGEIITIGADAHLPNDVGADFDKAEILLKECGFDYYCTFENRLPTYHKI